MTLLAARGAVSFGWDFPPTTLRYIPWDGNEGSLSRSPPHLAHSPSRGWSERQPSSLPKKGAARLCQSRCDAILILPSRYAASHGMVMKAACPALRRTWLICSHVGGARGSRPHHSKEGAARFCQSRCDAILILPSRYAASHGMAMKAACPALRRTWLIRPHVGGARGSLRSSLPQKGDRSLLSESLRRHTHLYPPSTRQPSTGRQKRPLPAPAAALANLAACGWRAVASFNGRRDFASGAT